MLYKFRKIYFTGNEVNKLFEFFHDNVVRYEFLGSFNRYMITCSDKNNIIKRPGNYPQFLIDFVKYKVH